MLHYSNKYIVKPLLNYFRVFVFYLLIIIALSIACFYFIMLFNEVSNPILSD